MCGIAGIVYKSGKRVDAHELLAMTNTMQHRGPDGDGFWTHQNIGFGHRRLAIIDLSDSGKQPMHYKGLTITYNGEIYNYIEVRDKLERLGYVFETKTDTEVLLAAYDYWGNQCIHQFNGMWAFAIYNPIKQEIFFSRDRFGKKPLYLYEDHEKIIFSSEIRAILSTGVVPKVNYDVLSNFLVLNLTEVSNDTFFEGIIKLGAGCNGTISLLQPKFKQESYYVIPRKDPAMAPDFDDAVSEFRNKLEQAVTWRLRSDVKVGTALSGGLDSSMIATIASRAYHQKSSSKFTAVTALSLDEDTDESGYASKVVAANSLDWQTVKPSRADFSDALLQVATAQEEPFHSTSIFMQYFVMQKAQQSGLKVLLDGQGADELLLGYLGHITPYLASIPWHKRWQAAKVLAGNYGISLKSVGLLYYYFGRSEIRLMRQLNRWSNMKSEFKDDRLNSDLIKTLAHAAKSDLFLFQQLDIGKYTLPMLLRYEDKNSMWFSVETRLPFLDYSVVEMAINTPINYRINNGWSKYLLRKAMEGMVPDDITWRKRKIGFAAPDHAWLGDGSILHPLIKESSLINKLLKHPGRKPPDLATAWRLASVALWEKAFNIKSE